MNICGEIDKLAKRLGWQNRQAGKICEIIILAKGKMKKSTGLQNLFKKFCASN